MVLQDPSFVEGAGDGGGAQNEPFQNEVREEQKDFNKCGNISRDEAECSNKNKIINETDSVNLVENEINAFCSPGQEEEECDQDPGNEESEEEQSYVYVSAGCSEANSANEFDVKLKVIFLIFMLTTLIQPPDNTFHRKAFSSKSIHSVNGKSRGTIFHGSSQDPQNNHCNNQCIIPNILSKTSCTGNICLKTAKDEPYETCCKCNSNCHLSNIESAVSIENSAAKDVDSSENYGVKINRYESIYSLPNIDNGNCSISCCDRLGDAALGKSSDATDENIKQINQNTKLLHDRNSKEVNSTVNKKDQDRVTNYDKFTEKSTHYQSNRCKEDLNATNGNWYRKNLEKTNGSGSRFPEGTPIHTLCGNKKAVQREILNDHTYRKILGKESFNYQDASLFKMKQNTEILDTKLLDLLFHPTFSRSFHQIAVFLMNGVINNEEDSEPDDQNMLNERHDSNVEFNETQVATNTEITERHVTSAEDDGSNGDDVEGDQLQLPFTEILKHEADTFSSDRVESTGSDSINGETNSNNGVTDHSVNVEENQNIISSESLAIVVVPDKNGYTPQNLLLTEIERNYLNLENSTLENSCVVEESKRAI